MPLYFFHLRSPAGLERDEAGLECADHETAYLEAYASIPELTASLIRRGLNPMEYVFEIEDAEGKPLTELPFMEMVRDKPPRPREPYTELMRARSQVERAHDLAASVREQVAALRREMQISREWIHRSQPLRLP